MTFGTLLGSYRWPSDSRAISVLKVHGCVKFSSDDTCLIIVTVIERDELRPACPVGHLSNGTTMRRHVRMEWIGHQNGMDNGMDNYIIGHQNGIDHQLVTQCMCEPLSLVDCMVSSLL